ncbi:hypothetical protein BDR03DRAFT_940671, partial [Suillus americanus]
MPIIPILRSLVALKDRVFLLVQFILDCMATAVNHMAKRNKSDHGCGGSGGSLANINGGYHSHGTYISSSFLSHSIPSQQRHHHYAQVGCQQELVKSFR